MMLSKEKYKSGQDLRENRFFFSFESKTCGEIARGELLVTLLFDTRKWYDIV